MSSTTKQPLLAQASILFLVNSPNDRLLEHLQRHWTSRYKKVYGLTLSLSEFKGIEFGQTRNTGEIQYSSDGRTKIAWQEIDIRVWSSMRPHILIKVNISEVGDKEMALFRAIICKSYMYCCQGNLKPLSETLHKIHTKVITERSNWCPSIKGESYLGLCHQVERLETFLKEYELLSQ